MWSKEEVRISNANRDEKLLQSTIQLSPKQNCFIRIDSFSAGRQQRRTEGNPLLIVCPAAGGDFVGFYFPHLYFIPHQSGPASSGEPFFPLHFHSFYKVIKMAQGRMNFMRNQVISRFMPNKQGERRRCICAVVHISQ